MVIRAAAEGSVPLFRRFDLATSENVNGSKLIFFSVYACRGGKKTTAMPTIEFRRWGACRRVHQRQVDQDSAGTGSRGATSAGAAAGASSSSSSDFDFGAGVDAGV